MDTENNVLADNDVSSVNDTLRDYYSQLSAIKHISDEDEYKYFYEYSLTTTDEARKRTLKDTIINNNLNLVVFIAKKYHMISGHYSNSNILSELIQAGNLGLMEAFFNYIYDPDKPTKFGTYAYNYIRGEIIKALNGSNPVYYPKYMQKLINQITDFRIEFYSKNHRYPTETELLATDIPADKISVIINLINLKDSISFDQSIGLEDDDLTVGDTIPDEAVEKQFEKLFNQKYVSKLLDYLDERDALIVTYYFGLFDSPKLSVDEISERLNISSERVNFIITNKAIPRLRKLFEEN